MSSLQEQLLKAGLVDENKLKQAAKEKNKAGKKARNSKGKAARQQASKTSSEAQQRQAKRVARDRELNQKRGLALEQKAIAAQVKQLVENNKVDRSKGEIPYSFVYRNKVKKMYIGEAQRPNTLTWFVTLNGAYLSKDLAQRCVLIRLDRPTFTGNWNGVDDRGRGNTYRACIFWQNDASDGTRSGSPYEIDILDGGNVFECFLNGRINDLRGTLDVGRNTFDAPDPQFDNRYRPRSRHYQDVGYRPIQRRANAEDKT